MRTTTNGGLLRIVASEDDAANEEPAVERVVPVEKRDEDSTAGWDPYEVWRTRVKAPRTSRDEPGISDPQDRH